MVEKGIFLVYNKPVILIIVRGTEEEALEDRHSSATRTISAVMAITLLGKVMGLYRDHLLAVHYGMGMEANAFYTASRIPRVFFDAVFASAIAACFIPVFSEYLEQKGKKEACRFAGSFITIIALLTRPWGLLFASALGGATFSIPVWGMALIGIAGAALFLVGMKYGDRVEGAVLRALGKESREM